MTLFVFRVVNDDYVSKVFLEVGEDRSAVRFLKVSVLFMSSRATCAAFDMWTMSVNVYGLIKCKMNLCVVVCDSEWSLC